ncbi:hypothetical protein AXG93_509s1180 [Marchantia polymorpha subsp. ruderalis]|uniref:Armadillo repeat-containing domain-containing protein n=1 Tax=Marchantia polymorpha subsp. ruderalis TaxID=1480154 RepID=A0A176WC27_MARPO|nr:hypothetical protein AXG93_509s1180 [Marchantia polymorpha subsp. ruderalis]
MQDLVGLNDVLVPEGSWRGEDCDSNVTADADHFSVCKPTSKTSNNYIHLLSQIEACHYQLRITQPVREAVTSVIVSRQTSLKKLPSLDLASLVDLKERLKKAPVELKTRLVGSSGFLHDLVRLLKAQEGRDFYGRIRATAAYILYDLARVKELRAQIGLYPQALRRLLKLLNMNMGEKSEVVKAALYNVRVLAATRLAFATDERRVNENSFLDRERACEVLVRMLEEKQIPNLQFSAAHTLANVPEYYSTLAHQIQPLRTLAILLLGSRSAESGEQNEGDMVHRVKVATIFEGITAGGANNVLQIAKCPGILENMVRVLEVTEDNPVQLQLSIVKSLHNIADLDYCLLRGISIDTDSIELLLGLCLEREYEDIKYYASSVRVALLRHSYNKSMIAYEKAWNNFKVLVLHAMF